jgi:hypothetical protein
MGFTPIENIRPAKAFRLGFTPLSDLQDEEQPSAFAPAVETVRNIGRAYPVLETAANLVTQAVALPVSGIAGLGAAATNEIGITESDPADVVHEVAGALTYKPQTEHGRQLTNAATYPFEKLAEAGQYVGGKTLDATGSPVLATAADTAINALPALLPIKAAAPKGPLARAVDKYVVVETPSGPLPNAVRVDPVPAKSWQNVATQSDAAIPITQVERASVAPLNQGTGMLSNENPGTDGMLKDAEVSPKEISVQDRGISAGTPRPGFTPLENVATQNAPAEVSAQLMNAPRAIAQEEAGPPAELPTEAKPSSNTDTLSDIPRSLKITIEQEVDGKTEKKLVNARKAMVFVNQRVERLQPNEGKPVFDADEMMDIRALANKNIGKMPIDEAERHAVQEMLDEALSDQRMVAELVRDELPEVKSADIVAEHNANIAPEDIGKPQTQPVELTKTLPEERANTPAIEPITQSDMPNADKTAKVNNVIPDEAVAARSALAPGVNYTEFADNTATAGKLAKKPIRREDVLAPFVKSLGLRLYEGRVQGKRLGFYIPKLEAVRIKHASDLEVAAHEIAHALDDRIPEIRESWLKGNMAREHANELKGVSYDKSKVYEGFAEFVRLYMTQPEKAKAAAPSYFKWFDNFTKTHEYGPAIRKAQEGMTGWFKQDALARAQSKIGAHRVINEALDGMGDKFRQAVADDLHGVYRMERHLTGKTSPLGAYETARLTRGAGGLVDGAIRLGTPVRKADGSFDFQGKGLEKILEPVAGNLDEFLMYAVGRSAHELMMQGREKLFTPAEVRSMLELKRPKFETAFAEYQQWNKGVLDFAESMGVINKQARSLWQRSQYIPFYRVGQPGASASRGGAQGNWAGIQALTGGSGNLRDILGNITQNAATLIDTALKNEARSKIVNLSESVKGGGNFLVKIAPDSKLVKIDREQIKDKLLESMGIDPMQVRRGNIDAATVKVVEMIEQQMDGEPGMFEFLVHGQTPKGNIMAVLEDGKPTYYEIADPLLYRAVSSLSRAPQHWIVKWLGLPKRLGQMTVTLTPDFMVANIARDTIMGAVMSRAGFRPFVDSAKGMASRIKQDPSYREYLANGGGFASYLKDENTFRAHLERFYTSKGINPKTVLDTPDKMLYFVETLADAFEMSTRLGEYKRLREQGEHPRHAAYLGRDISTDFAMKGDSQVLGAMYDTVMFLRPAVVSMDRLYRGLAHDPNKGAIAAKAGTIALLSAWLYWHNKDNPKYDEMEDWDKDNYWHFFIPVNGKEEHFRYPKIWEVGAISSLAERTVAKLNEQEPEYGKSVGRILKSLFNMNMMPQVVAPLYEQATNRNSFTSTPIETLGMENMQPFLRAKPTTSEILKAAGMATRDMPESMQVNPVRAEALLRGYFSTWGIYGLMLADKAMFANKLPEKRMDELPVVRRFYEAEPVKHTKYETMFYDMLGEAQRLHGTMRELDATNRSAIADEIEKAPLSGTAKQLERANRNIQTINGDMEEVRRSLLMPAEKRARLDALTAEKNALLKATVLDVKAGGETKR